MKTPPHVNGTQASAEPELSAEATPLMTPAQAANVLDKVLVDRVMGMLDLDELASFECDLFYALRACGIDPFDAATMSRDMITSAFQRFGEELRMRLGQSAALSDCELCGLEVVRDKRTRES